MKQLPLELPFRQLVGRDDFIVSDCNALALASIDQWPNWQGGCRALNIVGPPGAGKSHLAAIWQSMVQNSQRLTGLAAGQRLPSPEFYVLDEVAFSRAWNEEALFHCFNRCAGNTGGILLLSQMPVGQMDWQLPDLLSRMRAVSLAKIDLPDDNLLFALLDKYFADRQMMAPPAMLSYLIQRMERSFTAVRKLGAALDHRSIAEKKPLSVALARRVLDDLS
jgi:chromosomal replication initiation ATPase DnaA